MGAGAGPSQAVELEGVGERTIGERRSRRLNTPSASAEDTAFAAGPGALGIVDDNAAPRQRATADAGRHRVDDAILRLLHDRRRQVLVVKRGGIFGEPDGFVRHVILFRGKLVSRRIKPWKYPGAKSSTSSSSGPAMPRPAPPCRRARTGRGC